MLLLLQAFILAVYFKFTFYAPFALLLMAKAHHFLLTWFLKAKNLLKALID